MAPASPSSLSNCQEWKPGIGGAGEATLANDPQGIVLRQPPCLLCLLSCPLVSHLFWEFSPLSEFFHCMRDNAISPQESDGQISEFLIYFLCRINFIFCLQPADVSYWYGIACNVLNLLAVFFVCFFPSKKRFFLPMMLKPQWNGWKCQDFCENDRKKRGIPSDNHHMLCRRRTKHFLKLTFVLFCVSSTGLRLSFLPAFHYSTFSQSLPDGIEARQGMLFRLLSVTAFTISVDFSWILHIVQISPCQRSHIQCSNWEQEERYFFFIWKP